MPGTVGLGDYVAGLYATVGALIAYIERSRSGVGHSVDTSLAEAVLRMSDEMCSVYAKTGKIRERVGADHPFSTPNSHYLTSDDKWVAIACSVQNLFENLHRSHGTVGSAREISHPQKPVADRDNVEKVVRDWTRSLSREEILGACVRHNVPAGPINSVADIFEDEHIRARNALRNVKDPRFGEIVVPNVVPRLSETPGRIDTVGPNLGGYNDEIYRERLGLSVADIDQLKADRII